MKKHSKSIALKTAAFVLGGALLLPSLTAHAATSYTATDNDTFWKLSKKFGVPLQTLMNANSNIDPLNIYAGLKLVIPNTVSKASTATATAAPAKPAQAVTTSSGQSLSYSKIIDIKATAYSDSAEENGKWGPVDYYGNPLKLGTIAVDPKVIPLGSKLYVTGYDFNGLPVGGLVGTATDIGGAIKGNRIDIFIPGSREFVSEFGIQNVKVYVLK